MSVTAIGLAAISAWALAGCIRYGNRKLSRCQTPILDLAATLQYFQHFGLLRNTNYVSEFGYGRNGSLVSRQCTLAGCFERAQRLDIWCIRLTDRGLGLRNISTRKNVPYRSGVGSCLRTGRQMEPTICRAFGDFVDSRVRSRVSSAPGCFLAHPCVWV